MASLLSTGDRLAPARWTRRRRSGWIAPGDGTAMVLGSAIALGGLTGFWFMATRTSPDTWVPMLVIVSALVVSVPLCIYLSSRPFDKRLRYLLLIGLVLKLLAPFARYYVNEVSYAGEADSGQYHIAGQVFLVNLQEGRWSIEGAPMDGYSSETRWVAYTTGALYTIVGPTYMGGFIVYAWVCWLGLVLVLQAFRISFPNAPPHLAAALIFLLPSMLYWPSSIGKDALMVFALGLVTYGVARVYARRRTLLGIAAAVPGVVLILNVRPHVLLVLLVGLAASLIVRSSGSVRGRSALAGRMLLLVLLIPLLLVGLQRMDESFGGSDGGFAVSEVLDRTASQTTTGGSAFETRSVTNPLDFPIATLSVLYRPFLFEASGPAIISAIEGSLLLFLTAMAGRWIWRIGPAMWEHQFVAFCGGYVMAFVFAFSNIGNAGILARQRVQLFPILMLVVLAAREHHRQHVELPLPEPAPPAPIRVDHPVA